MREIGGLFLFIILFSLVFVSAEDWSGFDVDNEGGEPSVNESSSQEEISGNINSTPEFKPITSSQDKVDLEKKYNKNFYNAVLIALVGLFIFVIFLFLFLKRPKDHFRNKV
jgi:hypothetical protein